MALIKISQLPVASSPGSPSDVLPVVQGGATKKAAVSSLGFEASGTSATTRTIQNKLRDVVSVKDFGAVGNGVADDTSAIQAAITSLSATGGSVYFPKGEYLVSASLAVTTPNITLYGDGASESIIKAATATIWILRYGSNADYLNIHDLYFKGAATNGSTTQYAIGYTSFSTEDPEYVTVRNCRFAYTNNGIVTGSGKYWQITGNNFDNLFGVTSGTGYGILAAENTAYCLFDSNKFSFAANKGRHAVYMSVGCTYSIASNNIVLDCNESAFVNYALSTQSGVIGNVITGNLVKGGGTIATTESGGIFVGGKVSLCTVSDNTIIGFNNIGIVVLDAGQSGSCTQNSVIGNRVINAGLSGIQVAGAKNTNVSNNFVVSASQSSSGTYRAIDVRSVGSWGSTVCENTRIVGNNVLGASNRSALTINSSAPVPTGTYVAGNSFESGATPGLPVEMNFSTVTGTTYVWNATDSTYSAGGTDEVIRVVSRCRAINFGTVAANSSEESTYTIPGLTTTNWTVVVTPEPGTGLPPAGLVWCGWVSAADTVTVRVANVTTGVIDTDQLNWRVTCFYQNGTVT